MLDSTLSSGASTSDNVWNADDGTASEFFVFSVGPAGDFDGDGLSDFVVLSQYTNHGGPDMETVYLFSGASLPYLAVDNHINPETPDYRLTGTTSIGFAFFLS